MAGPIGGAGAASADNMTDEEYQAYFALIEKSIGEGLVLNLAEDLKESAKEMEDK